MGTSNTASKYVNRYLRRTSLAIGVGLCLVGTGALAQSTTGSIFGQVPAGAAETVVVQSATGVTRQVPIDASGRYSVGSLPLGTYTVTLKRGAQNVDSRSNVTLRVGAGTDVSFSAGAKNAQSLAVVTVNANALPPIDVTSVDSRSVITAEQLKHLPLARSAEAIALLAPGAVGGSSDFLGPTGQPLVSFGGASVVENAYYINGMNVTDPLNGEGGITLPYGSIEQQETLTGGYSAAFGRSDGGVINQVGKRGTNEWHFGGQVLYSPTWGVGTRKNTYYPSAYPSEESGSLYQYRNDTKGWTAVESAYLGGPLIQDKLFLFASVEGAKTSDKYTSVISSAAQQDRRTYHDPKWYAKLDWNINDSNLLELTGASTKHSYEANHYGFDYDTLQTGDFVSAAPSTKTSADMYIAKYTGYLTDDLTVSAQYGKQETVLYTDPDNPNSNLIPITGSTLQNPDLNGGRPITNANKVFQIADPSHKTKGTNYRFDVTYKLGDHTITAGIDNQRTQDLDDGVKMAPDVGYAWQYGKKANPNEEIASPGHVDAPGLYPGGENGYFVDKYRQTSAASVRVEQRAQYIEDAWQVTDRWLVRLGLRNDQFTNYNSDGQPYIRQTKPQWAPRLGASWDVNGDSSFKVYANAGRYYLALPTSVALRGASGSLYTKEYYTYTGIDANGYPTGLTPIGTENGPGVPYSANAEYGQAPDPRTVTAKNLTAQYQDEYILGFDKQFNSDWTYGSKLIYRNLKNGIDDTCDRDLFVTEADAQGIDVTGLRGCYFFNPGRAATFQLPDGKGGYGQLTIDNATFGFPHIKRKYYAANFYLEHPFDGKWFARIDYTFSKNYGNSEGQVKSDIGQDDIAATQDWDYPTLMEYASGRLPNDHRHQLKAFGSYQITPEWNVAAVVRIASGAPSSCEGAYGLTGTNPAYDGNYYHYCGQLTNPDDPNSYVGGPAPYGSAGDTPWTKTLALSAEYRPSFADHKLAFSVDVQNVFNEQKGTLLDPDYSPGTYRLVQQYENPRTVRLGVTYDF